MRKIEMIAHKLVDTAKWSEWHYKDVLKPIVHTLGRLMDRYDLDEDEGLRALVGILVGLKKGNYRDLIAMERGRKVVAVEFEGTTYVLLTTNYKKQAGQYVPVSTLNHNEIVIHEDGTRYKVEDLLNGL